MTKKITSVIALAFLGCTQAPVPSEEIGNIEQALCSNVDGVPSAMAALAVAVATELRRWQPITDFKVQDGRLALTRAAKRRCDDGSCSNTQAILDLQRAPLGAVFLGDDTLDAASFSRELTANFAEQLRCEDGRPRDARSTCSAERHELTLASSQAGACDTIFTFHAATPNGAPLRDPARLANKLIFAGYPENEYLSFTSTTSTVSIDPTFGLNETGTTTTGSCSAACTKYSTTNIAGQCCSCSGETHSFARAAWSASLYICT